MFRSAEAVSGYILLCAQEASKRYERKPRIDAERNRERILEMAKAAFTRSGADASLHDIAKQAGVGPGTLYRHFPTRDALIAAVYHTEVEKQAAAQHELIRKSASDRGTAGLDDAFRWLHCHKADHRIASALNSVVGGPARLYDSSRVHATGAIDRERTAK